MRSSARFFEFALSLAGLVAALGACGDEFGPRVCDEPSRACDRPAQSATQTTLRAIRARAPAYPVGRPVDVRAVHVLAIDTYDEPYSNGSTGDTWVAEITPAGDSANRFAPCPLLPGGRERMCGISLFSASLSPVGYQPFDGDLVDLSGGAYEEFVCATCGIRTTGRASPFPDGRYLPQISRGTARAAGSAPPLTPIPVTIDELVAHNQELIGTLVVLEDVTAMSAPDARFGEIRLTAGSNALTLTQALVRIPNVTSGTHWDRVVGIVHYFYSPKLIPRSMADLVGQR